MSLLYGGRDTCTQVLYSYEHFCAAIAYIRPKEVAYASPNALVWGRGTDGNFHSQTDLRYGSEAESVAVVAEENGVPCDDVIVQSPPSYRHTERGRVFATRRPHKASPNGGLRFRRGLSTSPRAWRPRLAAHRGKPVGSCWWPSAYTRGPKRCETWIPIGSRPSPVEARQRVREKKSGVIAQCSRSIYERQVDRPSAYFFSFLWWRWSSWRSNDEKWLFDTCGWRANGVDYRLVTLHDAPSASG